MKFYEVRQLVCSNWKTLAFFKKKSDAEVYKSLYNTKITVSPLQVVEREFSDIKDHL